MRDEAKASCLRRLNRIEGQVRGLVHMVEADRYCIDIITQIAAVRTALRRAEEEILKEFNDQIIPKIILAEMAARQVMESERPLALDDKIGRAIGVLKYARLLSSEETLFFLSHLRLGVVMKRVTGMDLAAINSLFLNTQPAHLQRNVGKSLDGDARKAARAEFVRNHIGKNNL